MLISRSRFFLSPIHPAFHLYLLHGLRLCGQAHYYHHSPNRGSGTGKPNGHYIRLARVLRDGEYRLNSNLCSWLLEHPSTSPVEAIRALGGGGIDH